MSDTTGRVSRAFSKNFLSPQDAPFHGKEGGVAVDPSHPPWKAGELCRCHWPRTIDADRMFIGIEMRVLLKCKPSALPSGVLAKNFAAVVCQTRLPTTACSPTLCRAWLQVFADNPPLQRSPCANHRSGVSVRQRVSQQSLFVKLGIPWH